MSITLKTQEPARHAAPTARASALAHLVFERPDLGRAIEFLADFGLVVAHRSPDVVYLRGTAGSHYCYRLERGPRTRFVGAGFVVDQREELERLASLDGASHAAAAEHPGGGTIVALRDPSGFLVEVVHGQSEPTALPQRPPIELGNVGGPHRRVNETQRMPLAPAEIVRLGHYVVEVASFQGTCGFYTQHLGMLPSDVQVFDDGTPAVAFLRLNRGDTPADHHTLAIAQGVMPVFGHAAFEVIDADALGMGNRILRDRARRHAWGIGRHVLGSQLFDYWEDPWGARHEHYCDGDVFTAERPCGVHPVSREGMAQWGPPMPRSFTKPRLSPAMLAAVASNVRSSPDLNVRKVLELKRLFG